MLKNNGIKSHMFQLNSPGIAGKGLGVDSFDIPSLTGSVNGIIWKETKVYQDQKVLRFVQSSPIKKINLGMEQKLTCNINTSPDGTLDLTHVGWNTSNMRCKSPNCPKRQSKLDPENWSP